MLKMIGILFENFEKCFCDKVNNLTKHTYKTYMADDKHFPMMIVYQLSIIQSIVLVYLVGKISGIVFGKIFQ